MDEDDGDSNVEMDEGGRIKNMLELLDPSLKNEDNELDKLDLNEPDWDMKTSLCRIFWISVRRVLLHSLILNYTTQALF